VNLGRRLIEPPKLHLADSGVAGAVELPRQRAARGRTGNNRAVDARRLPGAWWHPGPFFRRCTAWVLAVKSAGGRSGELDELTGTATAVSFSWLVGN